MLRLDLSGKHISSSVNEAHLDRQEFEAMIGERLVMGKGPKSSMTLKQAEFNSEIFPSHWRLSASREAEHKLCQMQPVSSDTREHCAT